MKRRALVLMLPLAAHAQATALITAAERGGATPLAHALQRRQREIAPLLRAAGAR